MTEPDDMTPEMADLAARLSKLDLDNPQDLESLFQMQEELAALAGVDMETPISPDDLPTIAPDPEPSDAYLAAADANVPLPAFIELVGTDAHESIDTQTLLFPACITGSLDKTTWLITQGLDPDHRDKNGYSPLIYACLPGINANLELIRFLIDKGADVNAASSYSESPLRLSLRTGNYEAVRILINAGVDTTGFPPLHQAAAFGDLDAISKLVSPATLEERDTWKRTPWLTAIHADQTDAAQLLKSCGADTASNGHFGHSALHLAAASNAHNAIRYLLTFIADIDPKNEGQATPLHEAAENDALDAAAVLIHAGADVQALTHTQDAPIHHACSVEMLELLHNAGADLNQISGEGRWPLFDAAEDGDLPSLQWLHTHGADINRTSTGATALHAAVNNDQLPAAQFLIDRGTDINARDVDGETALFYTRSIDAARLLLEAGADPAICDQCGTPPAKAGGRIAPDIREFIQAYPTES